MGDPKPPAQPGAKPSARELSAQQRALLARHLGRNRAASEVNRIPRVTRVPGGSSFPLSFAQQRLWFLEQLEPGDPDLNVPVAVRLRGPLDLPALERSLAEIVRRHESLRTRFEAVQGLPCQIIEPSARISIPVFDLRRHPEPEAALAKALAEESCLPFDLSRGPLFRIKRFVMGDAEQVLAITIHHIVADGWSMAILVREFGELYGAFLTGQPAALPVLPIQYVDFADWQRQWLQGKVLEDQVSYWQRQLDGMAVLQLPTDLPRPAVLSNRGRRHRIYLSAALHAELKALSRREGATLFMPLLAAFDVLLQRYTGQDDIPVGSLVAGRNRSELEPLIGFFLNTLVLRTDCSGNPSVRELIARVREVALGAYAHENLPFEKLLEVLGASRSLNQSPLFQVMFLLQNAPDHTPSLAGLELTPVELYTGTAPFDLTLVVQETKDGALAASIDYREELFEASTIERMIGHFQTLLEGMVAHPEAPIDSLALMGEPERHRVLALARQSFPRCAAAALPCLPQLIEMQAARIPSACAVEFGDERLNYRQLNERANQVARYLLALDLPREARIAILAERSLEMVVALVGVLKSGLAYVPLDPSYPVERLALMVEDSGPAVVLLQEHLRARFPPCSAKLVDLACDDIARQITADPGCAIAPDDLAYIIHTSGSTGRPKGVSIPHRGLANHALAMGEHYRLRPGQRVLQFFSLSFDGAAEDLYPTLAAGATVVLHPNPAILSPAEMALVCETMGITVVDLPTAYWHTLTDTLAFSQAPAFPQLEVLAVSGEPPSGRRVRAWADRTGRRIRFVNTYGPTEATITTTVHVLEGDQAAAQDSESVPIGRPIANVAVYILDARGQLVPIGVPGELYIGGVGVGRGYLGLPDLTARCFIEDPFAPSPGARMYRTGDRARYRPDGAIEFLGRLDSQVKIRGRRIEPTEVETVLAQHRAVRDAVVIAREYGDGDRRLLAYVVLRGEQAVTPDQLRTMLKEHLPDYMVPSAITVLKEWPVSPNGKIDRKNLPSPDRSEQRHLFAAPRTTTEQIVARVWADVLHLEQVGIHDNFFELGGHSLLAVVAQSQVERAMGRSTSLMTFFQAPSLADLARVLDEAKAATPTAQVIRLQSSGSGPPFFCVHPVDGMVHCYLPLVAALDREQPVHAVQSPGIDDDALPLPTIEEMAADYVRAIRLVQPFGPYHMGGWSMGGVVALEMAAQLTAVGEIVASLVMIDAPAPDGRFGENEARWAHQVAVSFALKHKRSVPEFEIFSQQDREGHLRLLLELAQSIAGQPEPELAPRIRKLYDVYLANVLALAQYRARPYRGRVTLLRAMEEPPEEAYGDHLSARDPQLGWGALLPDLQIRHVPGHHRSMMVEPHVQILAQRLRDILIGAQGRENGRL
jgi:amino acid adenylation domain-containing protein